MTHTLAVETDPINIANFLKRATLTIKIEVIWRQIRAKRRLERASLNKLLNQKPITIVHKEFLTQQLLLWEVQKKRAQDCWLLWETSPSYSPWQSLLLGKSPSKLNKGTIYFADNFYVPNDSRIDYGDDPSDTEVPKLPRSHVTGSADFDKETINILLYRNYWPRLDHNNSSLRKPWLKQRKRLQSPTLTSC